MLQQNFKIKTNKSSLKFLKIDYNAKLNAKIFENKQRILFKYYKKNLMIMYKI